MQQTQEHQNGVGQQAGFGAPSSQMQPTQEQQNGVAQQTGFDAPSSQMQPTQNQNYGGIPGFDEGSSDDSMPF
jgi:hypothetical protein